MPDRDEADAVRAKGVDHHKKLPSLSHPDDHLALLATDGICPEEANEGVEEDLAGQFQSHPMFPEIDKCFLGVPYERDAVQPVDDIHGR